MVLRPDHERGPVAAGIGECLVERVQLRRRHADVDGALRYRQHVRARIAQELIELAAERVVADLELLGGLAFVIDVVRRVREDHVGQAAGENGLDRIHAGSIATQEPVLAHHPDVAERGDRVLLLFRNRVVVGQSNVGLLRIAQKFLNLLVGESNQVEVEAIFLERLQFHAQHLLVPSGAECQSVVGEHQGPALRWRQMIQDDYRHCGQFQLPGRCQPRVAGDDHTVRAD